MRRRRRPPLLPCPQGQELQCVRPRRVRRVSCVGRQPRFGRRPLRQVPAACRFEAGPRVWPDPSRHLRRRVLPASCVGRRRRFGRRAQPRLLEDRASSGAQQLRLEPRLRRRPRREKQDPTALVPPPAAPRIEPPSPRLGQQGQALLAGPVRPTELQRQAVEQALLQRGAGPPVSVPVGPLSDHPPRVARLLRVFCLA